MDKLGQVSMVAKFYTFMSPAAVVERDIGGTNLYVAEYYGHTITVVRPY